MNVEANAEDRQPIEPCTRCGHAAEIHALDGRGVTPEPYCEADECACPRYESDRAARPEPFGWPRCPICGCPINVYHRDGCGEPTSKAGKNPAKQLPRRHRRRFVADGDTL